MQTNRIVCLTPSSHVIYFLKSDRSALVQFHLCLLLVSFSFPEETTDFFLLPSMLKYCTDHLKRVLVVIKLHKCTVGVKLWPLSLHHLSRCFKNKSDLSSEDFRNTSPPTPPFVAPFEFVFEVVLESVCDPRASIALKNRNPPGASSPSIFIALKQTRAPENIHRIARLLLGSKIQ